MIKKQLDLVLDSEENSDEPVQQKAKLVLESILQQNPKKATVFHYYSGDIMISIRTSHDEFINLRSFCTYNDLINSIISLAENPAITGKLQCSQAQNYRKLQFDFS